MLQSGDHTESVMTKAAGEMPICTQQVSHLGCHDCNRSNALANATDLFVLRVSALVMAWSSTGRTQGSQQTLHIEYTKVHPPMCTGFASTLLMVC